MHTVYIALGSNIQPKASYLSQAIEKLKAHPSITVAKISNVYNTAPKGYTAQDDFYNMVATLQTTLSPSDLLHALHEIEQALGRVRTIKNGPRTIDLDILVYGQQQINNETLIVPHPRMQERAFVLVPLQEIAGEWIIPGLDQTVQDLTNQLVDSELADVHQMGQLDDLYDH